MEPQSSHGEIELVRLSFSGDAPVSAPIELIWGEILAHQVRVSIVS